MWWSGYSLWGVEDSRMGSPDRFEKCGMSSILTTLVENVGPRTG